MHVLIVHVYVYICISAYMSIYIREYIHTNTKCMAYVSYIYNISGIDTSTLVIYIYIYMKSNTHTHRHIREGSLK